MLVILFVFWGLFGGGHPLLHFTRLYVKMLEKISKVQLLYGAVGSDKSNY